MPKKKLKVIIALIEVMDSSTFFRRYFFLRRFFVSVAVLDNSSSVAFFEADVDCVADARVVVVRVG